MLIATPNRLCQIGMQTSDLCKVAEPVAMNVKKTARECISGDKAEAMNGLRALAAVNRFSAK